MNDDIKISELLPEAQIKKYTTAEILTFYGEQINKLAEVISQIQDTNKTLSKALVWVSDRCKENRNDIIDMQDFTGIDINETDTEDE